MEPRPNASPARQRGAWTAVSEEPDHPLAAIEGKELAGRRLRVLLGRSSRFGARYVALFLGNGEGLSREPVLSGLQHSGPLPSYNWVEVAETNERVTLSDGSEIEIGATGVERLFTLLFDLLPAGGHLMVEYDSAQRSETARGLTLGVPPVATPLGETLFRIGFGAHFKDWQIAEGGSEGPRKLQAYKPASKEDEARWRQAAARQLEAFLERDRSDSPVIAAARERARELLTQLT